MSKTVLSKILKQRREELGLTQGQAAEKIGISRRVYQKLEYTERTSGYDKAFKALGIVIVAIKEDQLK